MTTPDSPASREALANLLVRVEGADGPSRELDLAIAEALGQHFAFTNNPPARNGGEWWPSNIVCGKVTSSVDACLALAERVLRDGYRDHFRLTKHSGFWTAAMWPDWIERNANTAPLALLATILRAKIAETES